MAPKEWGEVGVKNFRLYAAAGLMVIKMQQAGGHPFKHSHTEIKVVIAQTFEVSQMVSQFCPKAFGSVGVNPYRIMGNTTVIDVGL